MLAGCLSLVCTTDATGQTGGEDPPLNVLFIAVDDLNDYVGAFGGHPQGLTPNMDRLASEGMKFLNAHCAASLCKPSRTSLMSGFRPSTTGVYGNNEEIREHPVLTNCYMIPQWLSRHGYFTTARGKIYHRPVDEPESWDEWVATTGSWGKPPATPDSLNYNMLPADKAGNFDWGPTDTEREETPAYQTAKWVESLLNQQHEKPFFIAAGIFRPHLPWFVPQEYFDKFPLEEIVLPEIKDDDMDDIPGQDPSNLYMLTLNHGKREEAMQAYLASANAADDAVGVMLDALENSNFSDNTVVIFWGDHGWHLGEKLRYKKFTLWEESTRMPLVIKVPGMTTPGSSTEVPVNLIDLYPTITDLCNLPPNTNNEGESLVKLLKDPSLEREDLSLCTMGEEKHTIRTNHWRFIQRQGIPQELYNHLEDPLEHDNLYGVTEYGQQQAEMKFLLDSMLFRAPEEKKPVSRHTIPGVIQAEKFDRGGEGKAYHDSDPVNHGFTGSLCYYREAEGVDLYPCDDMGGGFHVGNIVSGEWLRYGLANVEEGTYAVKLRIRTGGTGSKLMGYMNGGYLFEAVLEQPGSGAWQDLVVEDVSISAGGDPSLELYFTGSDLHFNTMEFIRTDASPSVPKQVRDNRVVVNQADGQLSVSVGSPGDLFRVDLYDLSGQLCLSRGGFLQTASIEIPSGLRNGIYMVKVSGGSAEHSEKVLLF